MNRALLGAEFLPDRAWHKANHAILRSWSCWLSDSPHKFAQTGGHAESVRNEGRLRLELDAFGTPQKNKAVGHAGTNGFALVYPIWVIGLSHRIHPTEHRGILRSDCIAPARVLSNDFDEPGRQPGGVCFSGNALPQSSEFALISRR